MSNSAIAILRVVHIAFGSFWLGGAITLGFLIMPAAKAAAGASARDIMAPARALAAITAGGLIAILAGFILYGGIWTDAGFSGPARWYSIGAYFATGAIAMTAFIGGPIGFRLNALSRTLEGSRITDEQNALRVRLTKHLAWASRLTAALLLISAAFMAVARYV